MLGGLHIEMATLNMSGKWLDGSGWSSALVEAGITTCGRVAVPLSSSHVKHFCYAHQVIVASLHILQIKAYHNYCEEKSVSKELLLLEVWSQSKKQQHPPFCYYSIVMELELLHKIAA